MGIQTLNTNAALAAQQNSLGTTLSASRFNPAPGNYMQSSSQLFNNLGPMLTQFGQFAPMGQNQNLQNLQALTSALGQFTQSLGQMLQMASQGMGGMGMGGLGNQFGQGMGMGGLGNQFGQGMGMGGLGNQFVQGMNMGNQLGSGGLGNQFGQGLGMGMGMGNQLGLGGLGNQFGQGLGMGNQLGLGGMGNQLGIMGLGNQFGGMLPPGIQGQNGVGPGMNPNGVAPQNLPNGMMDKSEVTRNVGRYFDSLAGQNGMINEASLKNALNSPHEEVRQTAQALLNDPELMKQMDTAHARQRGNAGEKADGSISRGDMSAELGKTNFAQGDQQTISTLIKNFDSLKDGKGCIDKKKLESLASEPKNGNPQHDALVNAALDCMAKPELLTKLDNAALEVKGDTRSKKMNDGRISKDDLLAAFKASVSNTPLSGKTPTGAATALESGFSKVAQATGIPQAVNATPFIGR